MIEESLHKIQQRMADAMASVGRTDTALLVAVTKNHPVTAGEEGGPPWGPPRGAFRRAHTFHYSRLDTSMAEAGRSSRPGQAPQPDRGEALYRQGSVHASYFHAWFASQPRAVAALLGADIPAGQAS